MNAKTLAAVLLAAALGGLAGWALKSPQPVVARLLQAQKEVKRIPFRELIPQTTQGKQVLPLDRTSQPIIQAVHTAMQSTLAFLNTPDSPARQQRRINEVSRFAENHLLEALNAMPGFRCEIPTDVNGRQRRSGYPDLLLTHLESGRMAYLDPKLFEAGSETSTLRTFYFQPKPETSKLLYDAHHLLIGIRHDGRTGAWHFDHAELINLYDFAIGLKVEFQGSNKDLYRDELRVTP